MCGRYTPTFAISKCAIHHRYARQKPLANVAELADAPALGAVSGDPQTCRNRRPHARSRPNPVLPGPPTYEFGSGKPGQKPGQAVQQEISWHPGFVVGVYIPRLRLRLLRAVEIRPERPRPTRPSPLIAACEQRDAGSSSGVQRSKQPGQRGVRPRSRALMATTTVDNDMSAAPMAGERRMPAP